MEDTEVKQVLARRTTAKGVFTRHCNALTRLTLEEYEGKEDKYKELLDKLHNAYNRLDDAHQTAVALMNDKSIETDDIEQSAVELDSNYTTVLTRAHDWQTNAHKLSGTAESKDDGEPLNKSATTQNLPQEKLADSDTAHAKEAEDLRAQVKLLTDELHRFKLEVSAGVRGTSTPVRSNSNYAGATGPGLSTIVEESAIGANPNIYGDKDERRHVSTNLFTSARVGRGRARGRVVGGTYVPEPVIGKSSAINQRAGDPNVSGQERSSMIDFQTQLLQQSMVQQQSMMATLQAPSVKLGEFDGSPLTYTSFVQAFKEVVENVMYNDRNKLMILLNHCKGKARTVVEPCLHLSGSEGLDRALNELRKRFGKPYIIRQAWMDKLLAYPALTSAEVIESFALDIESCRHCLNTINQLSELECTSTLQQLVAKLPQYLRIRWRKIHRKLQDDGTGSALDSLVGLIREAADDAMDPAYGEMVINKVRNTYSGASTPSSRGYRGGFSGGNRKGAVHAIGESQGTSPLEDLNFDFEDAEIYAVSKGFSTCALCNSSSHFTFRCPKYRSLQPEDKLSVVRKKRLCHLCLSDGHMVTGCSLPWKCQERDCGLKHHTSLHKAFTPASRNTVQALEAEKTNESPVEVIGDARQEDLSLPADEVYLTLSTAVLPLTPVCVKHGNKSVVSYALLDSGSTMTLCTSSIKEKLGLKSLGKKGVNVNTVTDTGSLYGDVVRMNISQEGEDKATYELFDALAVKRLPITLEHLARGCDIKKWKHLQDVDIPMGTADKVELLIGQNNAHLLEQMDKVTGQLYEPYAVKTRLGWTVFGNLSAATQRTESTMLTISCDTISPSVAHMIEKYSGLEDENSDCYQTAEVHREPLAVDSEEEDCDYPHSSHELGSCMATSSEEIPDSLLECLEQFWKMEEVPTADELSDDDRRVLKLWDDHFRIVDGHVEIPIPLKPNAEEAPNNYYMALRSLLSLGKRLLKHPKELSQYREAMLKNVKHRYMEKVPEEEIDHSGLIWYLLHHGVDHIRKPDVTRVVAHGTAKFRGFSLATITYKGPDMMNGLTNVLIRFRQYEYASAADIESMFNQVKVPPKQRDAQRVLFWEDGDPNKKIVVYRMTGHIFGTGWAPAAANYALKRLAKEFESEADPEVVESVQKEFYVDDWLGGQTDEEKMKRRVKDVRELVSKGNFNLTKVHSNSRKVIGSVSAKDRAKELAQIDLSSQHLPQGVMLGQLWHPETDHFGFHYNPDPKPLTRRGMMSCVAGLYDPLGLLCPFVLPAKLLLRDICKAGKLWDEPLESDLSSQWARWLKDLPKVDGYEILRWLGCSEETINTLHMFGDACFLAYGAVGYLVVYEPKKNTRKSLIVSVKSKLAPSRSQTIPRLELGAATLAVKLELVLRECFSVKLEQSFFYSDSDIVLKMLLRDPADFEPFVRNRVSFILEHTERRQWAFIPGTDNPADLASRGCSMDTLLGSDLWKYGPQLIREPQHVCLGELQLDDLPQDFAELKKRKPVFLAAGKDTADKAKVNKNQAGKRESEGENDEIQLQNKRRKISEPEVQKVVSCGVKRDREVEGDSELDGRSDKKVKIGVQRNRLTVNNKRKRHDEKEESRKRMKTLDEGLLKLMPLLGRYSSRIKTVRAVAWILRVRVALKTQDWRVGQLSVLELKEAEKCLMVVTQRIYLPIQKLGAPMYAKLSPRFQEGIWVVGGRLEYSQLEERVKHPWLVPEDSPLSAQLIAEAHERVVHGGVDRTMVEVAGGYWLMGGRREVRRTLASCIICRRYKAPAEEQLMAPLPAHRLVAGKPPFDSTGVDLFGPLLVTVKRSTVKRYGVLFTCFTCRAIHLEVAADLTTSAFICALERFIARRSKPSSLHSDNGTNFVGARNQLRACDQMLSDPAVGRALVDRGIDWKLNTPAASHQGGAWERQIRTVRSLLTVLLQGERVCDDKLVTTLCIIEGIVNNRPLTRLSEQVDADVPLTPAHILNLRSSSPLFPLDFTADRLRRDWKQAQALSDLFWKRWMQAYLPELQKRTRWSVHKKNLEEGELVLIVQDGLHRGQWPLAVIKEVHPGRDGVVRNLTLRTATGELRRPIQKVVRLEADSG